ncbi:unnamed protein product [Calicophoron daubneyi]|uniref:K Homology domain-containing protein n=1 Tax=Calicophoron daubneyi TaxID=300641 RepID=A0AAV2TZ00_CALDB
MTKENDVGHSKIEEESVLGQPRKGEVQGKLYERIAETNSQKPTKGNVHFKILVPSIAAGAIIGKGGEAITDIQNKTAAKVKMSKANDFYPGTTERVCLIIGTIESILRVFQYISEKIYEKPESLLRSANKGGRMPTERHKQVKILVPNSTAGIIIGKGGSFIKEVKDSTGVFIQVSQKSKELNLAERCVTIAGELSQTYEAVAQLLVKIADDPQSSSCPNISYAEVPRPVASAYPTGSPYALVMGSGFGLNNCSMPPGGPDHSHLITSGPNSSGPGAPAFSPQLSSFSPLSPTGSNSNPAPVFGASPPSAFAAAMAAMGAATSFPPVSGGRNSSALSSHTAGRALTGRGGTTGHHLQSHSQPVHHSSQSLLGSVSTQLGGTGSPAYGSPVSVNSPSSSGSTIGLEVVRNILRAAGYSDVATEEIANAMHVLNLYGFISMSSLTGCAAGAAPINSSINSNQFAMTNSPLGNLSGSLSGYVSAGPQSPGFSNNIMSNELGGHFRSMRGLGLGNTPGQQYHQPPHHYQHFSPRRPSITLAQTMNLQTNSCTAASGPPNTVSLTGEELKQHNPLSASAPGVVTCGVPETHTSDVSADLYASMSSAEAMTLHSPTHSPIVRSLSPSLVGPVPPISVNTPNSEIPISQELIQRLSDTSVGAKTKDEGSTHSSNGSANSGNRPTSLWNMSCGTSIQKTQSSSS